MHTTALETPRYGSRAVHKTACLATATPRAAAGNESFSFSLDVSPPPYIQRKTPDWPRQSTLYLPLPLPRAALGLSTAKPR